MDSKIIEIEEAYQWAKFSSKTSPPIWQSWTVKGVTRESIEKYTGMDTFMNLKIEEQEYRVNGSDLVKITEELRVLTKNDPNIFHEAQKKCKKVCDDFYNFCRENTTSDFSILNTVEIKVLFNAYIDKLIATAPFRQYMYILGQIISDRVLEEIDRVKTEGIPVDFEYGYITPVKELPFAAMQKSILSIGAKLENKDYYFDSPEVNAIIDEHLEKYCWITTHRYYGEPITRKQVVESVKEKLGGCSKRLEELSKESLERKIALEKVKSINSTLKDILTLAQEYAYLLTYRIDIVNEGIFMLKGLLIEICQRIGVSYKDIIYLTYDEILTLLDRKVFDAVKLASLRNEYFVFYVLNNSDIFAFEGIKNKFEAEQKHHKFDVIKGKVAQRGRVRGAVKIINRAEELDKLEEGDIIVSSMTMPEMVLGLMKCGGIITDEGGIACHAAQISRELKIPCLIGTENASKVLHDGDVVELIAESINGQAVLLY